MENWCFLSCPTYIDLVPIRGFHGVMNHGTNLNVVLCLTSWRKEQKSITAQDCPRCVSHAPNGGIPSISSAAHNCLNQSHLQRCMYIWCSHAKTRVVGHLLWNQEKWGNSTLVYHKLSNTYVCSVHTYV